MASTIGVAPTVYSGPVGSHVGIAVLLIGAITDGCPADAEDSNVDVVRELVRGPRTCPV